MDQVKYSKSEEKKSWIMQFSLQKFLYSMIFVPVMSRNKLLPFVLQFLMLVLVLDLNDLYSLQLE